MCVWCHVWCVVCIVCSLYDFEYMYNIVICAYCVECVFCGVWCAYVGGVCVVWCPVCGVCGMWCHMCAMVCAFVLCVWYVWYDVGMCVVCVYSVMYMYVCGIYM